MPDITISLTPAQAQRVQVALDRYLQMTGAGIPEARTLIINYLKGIVENEERQMDIEARDLSRIPLDVT